MEKRICRACNAGEILGQAVAGRRTRYRCVPDLEIPADVSIPTCNQCGTEYLDEKTTELLDAGLKDAFQRVLAEKMEQSIETLKQHVPQRDLERLLGLSGGYLSKLKGGKETSAVLVAGLMLLAVDPASRIAELQREWETQKSDKGELTELHGSIQLSGRVAPMTNVVAVRFQPVKVKAA